MIKVTANSYEQEEMGQGYQGANLALDSMLKRFKKQVIASRVLDESRDRQWFLKKSLKRKRKNEEHAKLMRKLSKGRKRRD